MITFGSGIAKLRAVDRLAGQPLKAGGAYLLRAVAAALTVGGTWLAVSSDWSTTAVAAGAAAVVVALLLLTATRHFLRGIVQAGGLVTSLDERIDHTRSSGGWTSTQPATPCQRARSRSRS